jgi:hypothetical protein
VLTGAWHETHRWPASENASHVVPSDVCDGWSPGTSEHAARLGIAVGRGGLRWQGLGQAAVINVVGEVDHAAFGSMPKAAATSLGSLPSAARRSTRSRRSLRRCAPVPRPGLPERVCLQLSERNVLGVVGRGPSQLIPQVPGPTPEHGIAEEPDRHPTDAGEEVTRDVGRDLAPLDGLNCAHCMDRAVYDAYVRWAGERPLTETERSIRAAPPVPLHQIRRGRSDQPDSELGRWP